MMPGQPVKVNYAPGFEAAVNACLKQACTSPQATVAAAMIAKKFQLAKAIA
jgi:hypothetical protein